MLSYWVSDVLVSTLEKDQSKCTLAFDEIQQMWSKASRDNTISYQCKPYSSIINYYLDWENAKVLYDYYIDFDYINKMTSNCGGNCQELCSYLIKINDIYKSYKDFCSGKENHLCPLSKIKYENCNPMSLLNTFNCNTSTEVLSFPQDEPSEEEYDEDTSIHVAPIIEEARSTSFSKEDSQEDSELISGKSKTLSAFGNSHLGLVLVSMLFGVLYKVNENYIDLYIVYYPSKSILYISICYKLLYWTCTLLFLNLQVDTHRKTNSK